MGDTTNVNKLVSELFKGIAKFLREEYSSDPGHANKYRTIAKNAEDKGFIGYKKSYGEIQDLVPGITSEDVSAATLVFKSEMSKMGMDRANKGTHSDVIGDLNKKAQDFAAKAGRKSEGHEIPSFDNIEVPRLAAVQATDTSRTV